MTTVLQRVCDICNKATGVYDCRGCQRIFCRKHVVEHNLELSREMDNVVYHHDLLRQQLSEQETGSSQHPLMKKMNNWEHTNVWIGIPYAASPVGLRRWQKAQPYVLSAKLKDTVQNATHYGPSCPQIDRTGMAPGPFNEDCLYLNIWAPRDPPVQSTGYPVMLWIHGGGFFEGSSSQIIYDGLSWTNAGIQANNSFIMVSINYRLNVVGFFAQSALVDDHGQTIVNQGISDQRIVMQWVRNNIRQFGGNSDSITLMGQSAGSHSVCTHIVSPLSTNLFHAGILDSGTCHTPTYLRDKQFAHSTANELALLVECNMTDSKHLLLNASVNVPIPSSTSLAFKDQIKIGGVFPFDLIVDGIEIPVHPFQAFLLGNFNDVPILIEATQDEFLLRFLYEKYFHGPTSAEDYLTRVLPIATYNQSEVQALYALDKFNARPKWRFLVRFLFITISIGLRVLAIILYATASTHTNDKFFSRTQKLSWICGITLPSSILTLLLDYYHYRVWWHYIPSCDQNPFHRRYLKKHRRFIPHHLMGAHRNEIQLWNEPCELRQFCFNQTLEHIMIFHYNTHTPTPRWCDVPNKDPLTTTYIGFHRTDAQAAVNIAYTDFRTSRTGRQMLGFGIYFARSSFHTQFKARRNGAVICAKILMGRVLEIENDELANVSNSDAWHQNFDTIYYRHPRNPLRDEFCIKSNEQILKWVMYIEPPFDTKVEQYGLHREFSDTLYNTTHVAYGEIMGYASTNVPAYSNENDTYISYESYYLYGVYMGIKWQCVEYARRWLLIRKGCVFKSIVGAADIWTEVDSVQRVIDGKCFPLKKHPNGSPLPPKNESLLIYTRSGIDMPYGHVAMIVDILPDFIRVAEENYDFSYWSRNYSREIPYRMINGSYYVEDEYPVFGWMTVEDNNQTKPLDEATINILIKLNGSLASTKQYETIQQQIRQ
ncbi:unnamed protein product [Rotaria sordida]|uniref:Peptidase C51 domain-containing protein n=1 Tax=Rotaria sordida TaxID=392033 RepID=A0A813YHG2_9BILA|nr:unnamed protein product [Rotaria sordida]